MMERSTPPDESPARELEYYRRRCSELEAKNAELEKQVEKLESENGQMREELLSLKITVSAVVARSIDAKADTGRKRYKKSGRREGHEGTSRSRPEQIDATVELDQSPAQGAAARSPRSRRTPTPGSSRTSCPRGSWSRSMS